MMKFATTTMTIGIGEVSKALHDGDLDSSSQRQRGTVPHTSCNQRHAREAHHTPLVTGFHLSYFSGLAYFSPPLSLESHSRKFMIF